MYPVAIINLRLGGTAGGILLLLRSIQRLDPVELGLVGDLLLVQDGNPLRVCLLLAPSAEQ